ncbi:MAG: c-type cytochrome [Cocleimonas sp.]|nr:c-type cytochrome [Cocleimonas sp.]
MKLAPILLSTLLISASTVSFANDPVSQMMNTASDMMKTGTDTASDMVNSAIDTAKDVVDPKDTKSAGHDGEKAEEKETSKDFKWTKSFIEAIVKGDPKKGKAIAKKAKCSKCHGDTGVSDEDDTPSIAGQIAAYTFKQLYDYKVKIRDDRDMYKKVKNLSDQEMIDISAWYATQKPEKMAGSKKKIPVLANKGDKKRFLLACDTCHDEDAMKRGFQTPIIKGQKPEHFVETMMAFKEGERVNDHYRLMQSITAKLTEDEITELAAYYAAKPVEE